MYLGLDLGTSGLKAVVIDEHQMLRAEASAPLSVQRPHPGWSEQDPSDWVAAAERVLTALKSKIDMSAITGIGLSGQMHGAVMLDAAHTTLRPAILWNDTRAHEEAAELDQRAGVRETTGNIVFPGFTAPKLLWTQRHEPQHFEACHLVLLPKDYLRLWLTGEAVTEPSDASGTAWFDVAARTWSPMLLSECDLEPAQMPRIVEGNAVSAGIRRGIADAFGLRENTPVAGGAGDNAAAAIGMGVIAPGQAFLSLGTSGVLFAASDGFRPASETSVHAFAHALPGTWHQMGVILAATDALNWLATLLDAEPDHLTANLGPLQPPGRALFLPYLGGERTPHNDAAVRGAFLGLEHQTDRAAAVRAVLEGVAFAVADCQDALAATGTTLGDVVAVGGGSRSAAWLDIMATTLGVPINVPAAGETGAAFGAARLGLMAATGAGPSALTAPPTARTVEPRRDLVQAFSDAHARYRQAYTAIRPY